LSRIWIEKIYGPPGTGKTTTLIERARLEEDYGIPQHEILMLSFTKAPIAEILHRMGREEGFVCSTIHSMVMRAKGINGQHIFSQRYHADFESVTGIDLSKAEQGVISHAISNRERRRLGMEKDMYRLSEDFSEYLEEEVTSYKNSRELIEFYQLLTMRDFYVAPRKAILLDEAQDIRIEPKRFLLIVDHDTTELDLHGATVSFFLPDELPRIPRRDGPHRIMGVATRPSDEADRRSAVWTPWWLPVGGPPGLSLRASRARTTACPNGS